jgi:hypothetical protein
MQESMETETRKETDAMPDAGGCTARGRRQLSVSDDGHTDRDRDRDRDRNSDRDRDRDRDSHRPVRIADTKRSKPT